MNRVKEYLSRFLTRVISVFTNEINMKKFYESLFWFSIFTIPVFIVWAWEKQDLSIIKDIGLPLGAIIFTVGNLWHTKENQEFEKKKHLLERKDKYWDKRFKYYTELHDLVGTVNYELLGEDVIPKEDGVAFKDTKLGRVYKTLQELGDEGEILFNNSHISKGANISLLIKEIGEKLEKVLNNLQTIYTHKQCSQQVGDTANAALLISTYDKNVELRNEIEAIYDKCRTEIFSYLKLE